jgi:poly(A) polymerase
VVSFTEDWSEDAARRDFRLNALYLDPSGALYDPTGGGVEDARAGRILFVGDPVRRIREDYLRILRFFRFYASFGRGDPDPQALYACAQERGGLASLSAERVSRELLKLLAAEDPRPALTAMRASGVLVALLPEADALERAEALIEIETEILFESDALVRLGALVRPEPSAAAAVAARLRLPNAAATRFLAMFNRPHRIVSWMSPKEMRRAIHGLGAVGFKDQVKLAWAETGRPAAGPQWRMLLVYPDTWTVPSLPLSGEEIMAAGVPRGPLVGAVRREVETWWIDLDFTDDKMAVLERLKAVAQGMVY